MFLTKRQKEIHDFLKEHILRKFTR